MSGEGRLRIGFIALNDAAAIMVAQAKGFFAAEGLDVELSREVSWATVRDKVMFGALSAAHMVAPLSLAMTLGVSGADPTPLITPLALNLNGPAVTMAARLAAAAGGGPDAEGLARLIARRRAEGASPITFAVVFPYSIHNYLLRDWLARAGIDPDHDIRLTYAPPPRMTGLLIDGVVEGFCVTEPWNTAAVAAGVGKVMVRGSQLWPRTPDKVLAVQAAFGETEPAALQALLRAILAAAAWCDAPENRGELARILAQPHFVGAPAEIIEPSLADMIFFRDGANAPLPVHAAWMLSQMMRWGHIPNHVDIPALAAQVFRPDLYAAAAESLGFSPGATPEVLEGFAEGRPYRLADARTHAAEARLSRVTGV